MADAAAAIGARRGGVDIGELGADLSALSFNGNKTITSGGGGMLVGEDVNLIERCRHLSSTARVNAEYEHDAVAFNYRMTCPGSCRPCTDGTCDEFIERKRAVRDFYNRSLCKDERINTFPVLQDHKDPCWLSGVTLDGINVDQVIAKLSAGGVQARRFYRPVHMQSHTLTRPTFRHSAERRLVEGYHSSMFHRHKGRRVRICSEKIQGSYCLYVRCKPKWSSFWLGEFIASALVQFYRSFVCQTLLLVVRLGRRHLGARSARLTATHLGD